MKPVFGEVSTDPLSWCEPLEKMIVTLRSFKSLRDILKTNFIEQGRKVKETAGNMFYDPTALLAFVRFNFLLRRTLIELMHADLIYIRSGINHLESAGARTIDCQSFGLTAAEPIAKVRQLADDWKQPFQKEYTERSVNQAFDKLLSLRADIERAVEKVLGKPSSSVNHTHRQPFGQMRMPRLSSRGQSDRITPSPVEQAGRWHLQNWTLKLAWNRSGNN